MSRYVNRHLTSVKPIVSSIGSMMGSAERLLGVMVLLPPTPACGNKELMSNFSMKLKPTQVLQAVAQVGFHFCLCVRVFKVFLTAMAACGNKGFEFLFLFVSFLTPTLWEKYHFYIWKNQVKNTIRYVFLNKKAPIHKPPP